jgi:hypothetical protein
MPRRCNLGLCVRCKDPSIIGAFIHYYAVGQPRRDGCVSPKMTQIKGSLRARGYCLRCFLDVAKEQGSDRRKMAEVRRRLGGNGDSRSKKTKVRP